MYLYMFIDVMLSVTEWSSKLTNSISLLCESWWLNELKDKESVITNMILYVLARTFYETAKVHCTCVLVLVSGFTMYHTCVMLQHYKYMYTTCTCTVKPFYKDTS